MSSDGPEYGDPRCPGCGKLFACTCPKLAEDMVPVYKALKAARTDDAVEKAAACIWGEITDEFWSRATPEQQDRYRGIARAALSVAGLT